MNRPENGPVTGVANNRLFGARSWRYATIVNDGTVEAWFEEPGRCDNCADDPYGATSPEAVLEWLQTARVAEAV